MLVLRLVDCDDRKIMDCRLINYQNVNVEWHRLNNDLDNIDDYSNGIRQGVGYFCLIS